MLSEDLRMQLMHGRAGMAEADLAAGARRGSMEVLTEWTLWADKVLVF